METLEEPTFRMCIHELNGKYQWRWMSSCPPESNGKPDASPVFETLAEALKWGPQTTLTNERTPERS